MDIKKFINTLSYKKKVVIATILLVIIPVIIFILYKRNTNLPIKHEQFDVSCSSTLNIISANYGLDDGIAVHYPDVTNQVKSMVVNNELNINTNNYGFYNIFGDVFPGAGKVFVITYQYDNGSPITITKGEYESLNITCPAITTSTTATTTIPSTISSTSSSLVTLPIQGIRISINMGTDVIPESPFLDNNIKIFGLLMYDETGAMISSSRVNNTVSTSMKPGYSKTAYYTGLANYQISNNKTRTYNDMISASNKFTSTISGLTTTDTNIALPPKFTFDDMDNKYTYASSTNNTKSNYSYYHLNFSPLPGPTTSPTATPAPTQAPINLSGIELFLSSDIESNYPLYVTFYKDAEMKTFFKGIVISPQGIYSPYRQITFTRDSLGRINAISPQSVSASTVHSRDLTKLEPLPNTALYYTPTTTMPSTTMPSTTMPSTTMPSTTMPSTTMPSTTMVLTTKPATVYRNISGRFLLISLPSSDSLTIAGVIVLDQFGNNIFNSMSSNLTFSNFIKQSTLDFKYTDCTAEKSIIQTRSIPFKLDTNYLDSPDTLSKVTNVFGGNTPSSISSSLSSGNMSKTDVDPAPYLYIDLNPNGNNDVKIHSVIIFNRTDDGCYKLPTTTAGLTTTSGATTTTSGSTTTTSGATTTTSGSTTTTSGSTTTTVSNTMNITNCCNALNNAVISIYDSNSQPALVSMLNSTNVNVPTATPVIKWIHGSTFSGSIPLKYKVFVLDLKSSASFTNVYSGIERFSTSSSIYTVGYTQKLSSVTITGTTGLTTNLSASQAIDITVKPGTTTTQPQTTNSSSTSTTSQNPIPTITSSGYLLSDIMSKFPQLTAEQVTSLLNSGINLLSLMSSSDVSNPNESVSSSGVKMSNQYKTPQSNIIQTDFSGTSNIFSPFLYYNKNSGEAFTNVQKTTKYDVDNFYRY